MANKFKLTYFNRGRGEPIRLIFALANVSYEDNIIQGADWPTIKPTTPWGQVPVLEVDGVKIAQTPTISRFLARKFNLVGSNELEAARCDELVDAALDVSNVWLQAFFIEKDENRKAELKKNLIENSLPKFLKKLEEIQIQSGGNFLVGKSATWADAWIANGLERFEGTLGADVLDNYPNLKKFKAAFFAIPSVKAYVDKRPPS